MKKAESNHKTFFNNSFDDKDVFAIIKVIKRGVAFGSFSRIEKNLPFSIKEWCGFLHVSERRMQQHKQENKRFDSDSSEKIIEIILLYKYGTEIFGNKEKFNSWLETKNVALGNIIPKEILDNTFGIRLLKDELTRIEHVILV